MFLSILINKNKDLALSLIFKDQLELENYIPSGFSIYIYLHITKYLIIFSFKTINFYYYYYY